MDRHEHSSCSLLKGPTAATTIDAEFLKSITEEARVLPLFEEKIHKYKYAKGYSLYNNEMLKCRWKEFVDSRKKRIPFMPPSVKDLHFVKNTVVLDPKETVNQRENHRFHLRCGPCIDKFGQVPIPDDMQFRRTTYQEPAETRDKKTKKIVKGGGKKISY